MHSLSTTVDLPDEDEVDVTVEFTIDYWGRPEISPSFEHSGREAEPPEFTIKRITRDIDGEDITQLVDEKNLYDVIFEYIEDQRY